MQSRDVRVNVLYQRPPHWKAERASQHAAAMHYDQVLLFVHMSHKAGLNSQIINRSDRGYAFNLRVQHTKKSHQKCNTAAHLNQQACCVQWDECRVVQIKAISSRVVGDAAVLERESIWKMDRQPFA